MSLRRKRGTHAGKKAAVIGGAIAAIVGAGYGIYSLVQPDDPRDAVTGEVAPASRRPSGPLHADEVRAVAAAFLKAWAAGDAAGAAEHTDRPREARERLTGYASGLHLTAVELTPDRATGTQVPFTVTARIDYAGAQSSWSYASRLEVVRDGQSGYPVVKWAHSVLHPKLGPDTRLATLRVDPPPPEVVDRSGATLDAEHYPGLAGVLSQLQERYADKVGGVRGVEIQLLGPDKRHGETLRELSKGRAGHALRTTLDAKLQRVAEAAVRSGAAKSPVKQASFTAVRPSTGEVLAVANVPSREFNTAFSGSYAPGSTFKVVTSAMLMERGKASPSRGLPCPKTITVAGWKFHNVDKLEIPNATLSQDFAASCNTAFISQTDDVPDSGLADEAREVFGLGLEWHTGLGSMDGRVPAHAPTGAQKAAAMIGQGSVRMNPLTMASVAATAQSGLFRQPVIVDPLVSGEPRAKARRSLPSQVAENLRLLMRLTARYGTAAPAVGSLGGDVGAKTGSAEVDGQEKPNSWFIAYRGDLAAGCVVPQGGHGADAAGPIVRQVLAAAG